MQEDVAYCYSHRAKVLSKKKKTCAFPLPRCPHVLNKSLLRSPSRFSVGKKKLQARLMESLGGAGSTVSALKP